MSPKGLLLLVRLFEDVANPESACMDKSSICARNRAELYDPGSLGYSVVAKALLRLQLCRSAMPSPHYSNLSSSQSVTTCRSFLQVFYNGNLYHDPRKPWSDTMRALVVNAGKLDEAALALSTEPVVGAHSHL